MAYFVTFAWHRGLLSAAERDSYHALSHRVGLSMDHELFTEDMICAGTEAILYVLYPPSSLSLSIAYFSARRRRRLVDDPDICCGFVLD